MTSTIRDDPHVALRRDRLAWRLVAALAIALASLLITGCAPRPATRVVVMSGTRFTPAVDTVQVGDTVVWKNDDLVPHTATADDRSFDSGNLDVGRAWRTDTRAAGAHPYRCLYHPGMVGTLVVRGR